MAALFENMTENAARLRELHERVHKTFRRQPHGAEHHRACAEFHRLYDSLAFPGGLEAGLRKLRECDESTIETTLRFLDLDLRFFRSGYIKQEMLRRLKHCPLTEGQRRRAVQLIIRSVDGGGRREFRGYSRLAGVVYSPELFRAVNSRITSSDPEVVRRAGDILNVWRSRGIDFN